LIIPAETYCRHIDIRGQSRYGDGVQSAAASDRDARLDVVDVMKGLVPLLAAAVKRIADDTPVSPLFD
jgi:hypothetical protein